MELYQPSPDAAMAGASCTRSVPFKYMYILHKLALAVKTSFSSLTGGAWCHLTMFFLHWMHYITLKRSFQCLMMYKLKSHTGRGSGTTKDHLTNYPAGLSLVIHIPRDPFRHPGVRW